MLLPNKNLLNKSINNQCNYFNILFHNNFINMDNYQFCIMIINHNKENAMNKKIQNIEYQ